MPGSLQEDALNLAHSVVMGVAGSATLLLLAPDLADNQAAVTRVSIGWLAAASLVVVRGIAITGAIQTVMPSLEIAMLALVVLTADVATDDKAQHREPHFDHRCNPVAAWTALPSFQRVTCP